MRITEAVAKGFSQVPKVMNVVLIFLVFNVIVGIVSLPLTDPANAEDPQTVAISVVLSIVFFLAFIFLQGGALGVVKDQIKTGTSVQISRFMEYGKKFYLRILGVLLMYILIAVVVVFLMALISGGILFLGDNTVTRAILFVLIAAVSIPMITMLIYPIYALVVDDSSPVEALKKGIATAKANFLKTLGLFLLMLAISFVISFLIGIVAGFAGAALGEGGNRMLISVVNSVVQSYIPIVMMIAFMSYYMSLTAGSSTVSEASGTQ